MSDALKKVKSGDRLQIPAQAYNAFVDAAVDYRSRQHSVKTPPPGGWRSSDTVKIKNISGVDVTRFQVLGIDGVVFDPQTALQSFQSDIVFTGNYPMPDYHSGGRFVVCATPIPNGTIGNAWASGICPVQVDIKDESHSCAQLTGWQFAYLTSTDNGPCTILWKEAGTGVKWALIRFGNLPETLKIFRISTVGESTLVCQEAYFDGTYWSYYSGVDHQAVVHKYPSFSNMTAYKVGKYIVAMKFQDYWVSVYNQPAQLQEYSQP